MFKFIRNIDYKRDLENKIFMVETAINMQKERLSSCLDGMLVKEEQGILIGLSEALYYLKMGA